MPIELTAHNAAGARLIALAEDLSAQLAARAAEHDRDGSYPFEAIDSLKAAGYFAAPIPIDLGGLGVSSAHDLVVASSRLARGDASVAIGVNMHLVAVHNMERRRQIAIAAGAERRARNFASSLQQIAHDGVVLAAAFTTVFPFLLGQYQNYNMLVFGVVLILVLKFAPDGVASLVETHAMRLLRRPVADHV